MNQQIKVEDLRVFIKTRFADAGYSQDRIRKFCKTAERLYEYMAIQKMENYTPEVGLRFVQTERLSGEVGIDTLRTDRRAIDVINLVLAGSPISIRRKTVVRQYPGDLGGSHRHRVTCRNCAMYSRRTSSRTEMPYCCRKDYIIEN